jgi:hypothetical protein
MPVAYSYHAHGSFPRHDHGTFLPHDYERPRPLLKNFPRWMLSTLAYCLKELPIGSWGEPCDPTQRAIRFRVSLIDRDR